MGECQLTIQSIHQTHHANRLPDAAVDRMEKNEQFEGDIENAGDDSGAGGAPTMSESLEDAATIPTPTTAQEKTCSRDRECVDDLETLVRSIETQEIARNSQSLTDTQEAINRKRLVDLSETRDAHSESSSVKRGRRGEEQKMGTGGKELNEKSPRGMQSQSSSDMNQSISNMQESEQLARANNGQPKSPSDLFCPK